MSSISGRLRSKEAPMAGLEFTHRSKAIPAWRSSAQSSEDQNTPLKRTHSIANPPPSPFTPKKSQEPSTRPVFGENVHYLFNPQPPQTPSWPTWATPTRAPDTPEVDMKDVEVPPPPHSLPSTSNQSSKMDGKRLENDNEEETSERRLISNAAVRRIARRRIDQSRSNRSRTGTRLTEVDNADDTDEDDYDEDGSPRRPISQTTSNHYTLNMPGPPAQKSDTPYVLLGYTQFLFNLSLILVFLYLLLQFIITVQRDVEQRVSEYSMDILQEITTCASLFKQNLCDSRPIPAMLHQCATWETCMNRDPKIVGRAKVGAEMLAEVINGFVEPISWKTLAFTLSSMAFLTVFVNALISLYRSRHHPDRIQQQPITSMPTIPHFPALEPSQYPASMYGYLGHHGQQGEWVPSKGGMEPETLPRQRRRLENGASVAVADNNS